MFAAKQFGAYKHAAPRRDFAWVVIRKGKTMSFWGKRSQDIREPIISLIKMIDEDCESVSVRMTTPMPPPLKQYEITESKGAVFFIVRNSGIGFSNPELMLTGDENKALFDSAARFFKRKVVADAERNRRKLYSIYGGQ